LKLNNKSKEANMPQQLLTPTEAESVLQVSKATITRCVKKGAPVHRRGAAGRKYLIDPEEFIPWMEKQVYKQTPITQLSTYAEKAAAFRKSALARAR
jgi:phage terminase Nu1 subunit (DNA packaging protein)